MTLRLRSHLAPSIPHALFDAIADHLGAAMGLDVALTFDEHSSGPRPGQHEDFSTGGVDLAFVCASSYAWLSPPPSPIRLAGVAWAPTDPRAAGRAQYYGDLLTTADGPTRVDGLAGRRVGYNDESSLSGYHGLRLALAEHDVAPADLELVRTGSHLRSLDLLRAGAIDAAVIDSNVWRRRRRDAPELADGLREVGALGPHPAQPLVARSGLDASLVDEIREVLLVAHESEAIAAALSDCELDRFVEVDDADYSDLRDRLRQLEAPTLGG